MSENNETKATVVTGLLSTIAERVKGSDNAVKDRWIDTQVEKEVSGRVDLLDKAMQKRFTALTELNKVNRPDVVTYDVEGKETGAGTYTKERVKAIKDGKEALAKVESAIEKALAGDWSKLKETIK